ncbi:MAG: GNAT family N-acetyltransferase [Alphaproteobacteria bacterium]
MLEIGRAHGYMAAMNLVLRSERLLLRPLAETDLDVFIEILSDPAVMKYVGGKTYTIDQVVQELPTATRRCAGGCIGIWCVIDQSTKEKLGYALLLPLPIEEKDTNWDLVVGDELPDCEVEIGYLLKKSAWGKGYATEACKRLLKFAFEETRLKEVVAVTNPKNMASQNVLRKSGLIEEGMRRAYASQCPGFRITRQQWSQRNQNAS